MITRFAKAFAGLLLLFPVAAMSCGGNDQQPPPPKAACSTANNSGCGPGLECQAVAGGQPKCFCSSTNQTGCPVDAGDQLMCEQIVGGNTACFAPLHVKGQVFDLNTKAGIASARVVARDANNAALSDVVITDASGNYDLSVPVPRVDKTGKPADEDVLLRADASGYLTFPLPPRVAIPVQMSTASGNPLTVQTSATNIGMLPLQSTAGLGSISGKVMGDNPRGTLVVAGGVSTKGGATTGVAAADGTYAVFNVPQGPELVQGFKAGSQLKSVTANVTAGQETKGVNLDWVGKATAVVSGQIDIVNPGAGKTTSVILAVDETFNDTTARGEAPPGLRVGPPDTPISGAFTIPNVPDGNYVVLAAFENDFLVRDPDTSIGGTAIVRIKVSGADYPIATGFKVTGALDVVSPDNEAPVSGTPTFVWKDDSGEDHYEIRVFDAFGTNVWTDTAIPGVSGSATVSVPYAGTTPLTPGVIYQFRATSIKQGGTPISQTEDLRGVFLYQ